MAREGTRGAPSQVCASGHRDLLPACRGVWLCPSEGKDTPAPTRICQGLSGSVRGAPWAWYSWEDGCLQVHQGEMTSHLSPSCSVRARSHPSWRFATAAPLALVGLRSRRVGERWAGQSPHSRLTLRLLAPSLPSWQAGGPSQGRLSTACTPQGSGSWVWQRMCPRGSWHSRRRVSVVTRAIPARLEHGSSDQSHPVTPCLLTVSLPTGTYGLGG